MTCRSHAITTLSRFTAVATAVSAAADPGRRAAALSALAMLVGATPDELIEGTGTVRPTPLTSRQRHPANLAIERITATNRSAPAIEVLDALIQQASPPAELKTFIDAAAQRLFGPPIP